MKKANLIGNLRSPFLKLRWRINRRALIRDAFYSVRSIKEIFERRIHLFERLLQEERKNQKNESLISEIEGRLKEIEWLFAESD